LPAGLLFGMVLRLFCFTIHGLRANALFGCGPLVPGNLLTEVFVTASFTTPFEGGFGGFLGGRFLKLTVLVLTYCVLGGASFGTWGDGGGAGGAGGVGSARGAGASASGGRDLMWRPCSSGSTFLRSTGATSGAPASRRWALISSRSTSSKSRCHVPAVT